MAPYSSQSEPKTEPRDHKGFDHMAAIVAQQLIQLFGDEDHIDDRTAIVAKYNSRSSTNKKKKRSTRYYNDVANGIEENSSREKITKKRRYRSIDNLYLATKRIDFLDGKKCFEC
ncbi:hypothetical protein BUALT_Bualt11G0005500 [Buddleja alternifolia]|uniref:Uncharacterized protein n=1 Tax=Buddleja alternifolia TaxID=168488 RepID=A0AAV6WYR5_9LAMI|nr:hypothetical protein BUALT_Bualt11G0005500 [Buddleja alternifolia]